MILRILVVAFCCLLAFSARAQTVKPCAVAMPFTFANGQVADANQVNTNFSTLLGCANNQGRVPIQSPLIMYLSPTGSDANNACTNSLSPCKTAQQAVNNLFNFYQFVDSVQVATIQYAAGNYTQSTEIGGAVPGQRSPGQLLFSGNTGTPTTVQVTGDNTQPATFLFENGAMGQVQGLQILGANGDGIRVVAAGPVNILADDFSTTVAGQIHMKFGAAVHALGNYTISGSAQRHIWADGPSSYQWYATEVVNPCCTFQGITVTINGTPAFAPFAKIRGGYVDSNNINFVSPGSATGTQCQVTDNGTLFTGTSGALVMPGTPSTCTVATGGIFD